MSLYIYIYIYIYTHGDPACDVMCENEGLILSFVAKCVNWECNV